MKVVESIAKYIRFSNGISILHGSLPSRVFNVNIIMKQLLSILKNIHTENPNAKSTLSVKGKLVAIISRREAANMQDSSEWEWVKWQYKEDWHPRIVWISKTIIVPSAVSITTTLLTHWILK